MKRVKDHKFLYERAGTYYFKRAIPSDVSGAFGGKSQVWVSLRTNNLAEARLKMGDHLRAFEVRVARARGRRLEVVQGGPERDQLEMAVRAWLADRVSHSAPGFGRKVVFDGGVDGRTRDLELQGSTVQHALRSGGSPPTLTMWTAEAISEQNGWRLDRESDLWRELCDLVARAEIEFTRQAKDELTFQAGKVYDERLFGADRYDQDVSRRRTAPLAVTRAIETFLADPSMKASDKTREKYRRNLALFLEWLGQDRKVASITRDECRAFRDQVICRLPRHRHQKFGPLPLQDVLAIADLRALPRIDPKTQNLIIDNVQAVFEWCVREGHRKDNPAKHLRVAYQRRKVRKPFKAGDLQKLFNAPLYVGCVDDGPGYAKAGQTRPRGYRFWLPLIALFTGMRLNEICQLQVRNIEERDGIWIIEVREDRLEGTRLKTECSARLIPVHPELVRIGLIEYAHSRDGQKWLFDIDREGRHGGSDPISKWFARFLQSVGLAGQDLVFHSFRHTFRDALREAGIGEERTKALGGWSDVSVANHYGAGHSVRSLWDAVRQIDYRPLNLGHLTALTNQDPEAG